MQQGVYVEIAVMCTVLPTLIDASVSKMVDSGEQRPESEGFLLRDVQDLQTVLDQVPNVRSTLVALGLCMERGQLTSNNVTYKFGTKLTLW